MVTAVMQEERLIRQHRKRDIMNIVTLMPNGAIVHKSKTVETNPLMFLSFKIELDGEYTLRSYFRMLETYSLLLDLNEFFPTFIDQFNSCPKNNCIIENIDHLEINKTVEMVGFPGKPRLEMYISFNGVQGKETCEIKSYQLDDLLDITVKLGNLKHIVFGDRVDIFEFESVYTLFEFIDGIAWELSFHGTPRQCVIRR
jgi:hypothetical protein